MRTTKELRVGIVLSDIDLVTDKGSTKPLLESWSAVRLKVDSGGQRLSIEREIFRFVLPQRFVSTSTLSSSLPLSNKLHEDILYNDRLGVKFWRFDEIESVFPAFRVQEPRYHHYTSGSDFPTPSRPLSQVIYLKYVCAGQNNGTLK